MLHFLVILLLDRIINAYAASIMRFFVHANYSKKYYIKQTLYRLECKVSVYKFVINGFRIPILSKILAFCEDPIFLF